MTDQQLQQYLHRIGLKTTISPDREGLNTLQKQHMLSVPFENLDVFVKRNLDLSVAGLFDKVVTRRRGGYCFELNTLFGALLTHLGFSLQPVLARVLLRDPVETPPRNHLAHLAMLNGRRLLTDVGFGGFASRVPLDIDDDSPVPDGDGYVRVVSGGETGVFRVERRVGDAWQAQYSFTTDVPVPMDVKVANFYTEKHPDSHFTAHRFIGLFTPTGRIGLFDNAFSERTQLAVTHREEVPDGAGWVDFVAERFGLRVNYGPEQTAYLSGPEPSGLP